MAREATAPEAVPEYGVLRHRDVVLINTLPYPVSIINDDDEVLFTVPEAPQPLRPEQVGSSMCLSREVTVDVINLYPNVRDVSELPLTPGVFYIVPYAVALVCQRKDFLVPHQAVWSEKGRMLGFRRFAAYAAQG